MPFKIRLYQPNLEKQWDDFVFDAPMATFMHTRRFVSYHGNRFQDQSVLIWDEEDQLVAVLPAGTDLGDSNRVVSHPGLSYGGLIHQGKLMGQVMLEVLASCLQFYRDAGFKTCRYKAIPIMYHQIPSEDDRYALFRLNANRYRCDLSSTVDVSNRPKLSVKRRSGFRKALESGMEIVEGPLYFPDFWQVLAQNLTTKYGVQPVHSLEEIQMLYERFPEEIQMVAGVFEGQVIAGVVLFNSPQVIHAQYSSSSEQGFKLRALDALFEHCIQKTGQLGRRYFDFGISTEQEGQHLNADLYQFKSKFGSGGFIHEFYDIDLTAL